jgi:IPT/TIG domain-containing protein
MSAPGPKDGDGGSPPAPKTGSHEIFLPGEDDPLIVLDADPARAVPRSTSPADAVPAVIDDIASDKSSLPRPQAEYTTEPPSIESDRVREDLAFPWAATAARRPSRPSPWPRRILLVTVGALIAFGAWAGFASLRPAPPVITSIVPSKAEPGQTVTIGGTALGSAGTVVRFGDHRGPVTSATESSLAATVPAELANLHAGDIRVVVEVGGVSSNALFMNVARYPRITAVEPEVALPGDEVSVKGVHLDGENVGVRIGGFPAEVTGSDRQGVRVKVPRMPVIEGKLVPVDVSLGRETARPGTLVLGHLPLVTAVAPASGEAGATVTIKGYGFAPRAAANRVTFGALEALVLSATDREIQASVPAFGLLGSRTALPAVVSTGGVRSAAVEFTVVRPSGDVFRPRFAAARPPGGDPERQAVVGTELGPVLVLSGPSDAASTAERAARVAARLNVLMQSATNRPVQVEVKEGPPLHVAAGGAAIVTVTAEDAEGLSRGGSGTRISAPVLARYWAALLHDYIGLFGQRLRPNRAIELTPRARVLMDLYSDAERGGGSSGVGTGLVASLPPDRLESLRRLADAEPDEGRGSRGLPLAGSWQGHIEDGGPPRSIRLQVRVDGDRLTGAMTSTAGEVAMGIPLRDLRYDRGMVRFSVVLGGAPRQFRGVLEGAALTGTIHPAEGVPATGRFDLRHVE